MIDFVSSSCSFSFSSSFSYAMNSLMSRFQDNPIFILTVSLVAQHCRYHCDYTRTQISFEAFKCYRADLLNNFFFSFAFWFLLVYFILCMCVLNSLTFLVRIFWSYLLRFYLKPFDRCTLYFYFHFVYFSVYHLVGSVVFSFFFYSLTNKSIQLPK